MGHRQDRLEAVTDRLSMTYLAHHQVIEVCHFGARTGPHDSSSFSRPRVPASRTRGLPSSLGSNRTRRNSVRYVGLKAFGKSSRRVVIRFFGSLRSSEWKSSETLVMEDLVSGSIRKSLIFEGFRRYAGKIFCVELLYCSWFL